MAGKVLIGVERFAARGTQRAGLTTLEFLGCITAVLGGAWIGAIYLGMDLRHVAHTALVEADLLEKVPPDWRPPGPKDNAMTREQLKTMLQKELGSLRSEIVALRATSGEVVDESGSALSEAAKNSALAYWSRLSDIEQGATALQHDAETAFNQTNAAKVFAVKGRVCRFTAKAVEAVPTEGVDPTIVQFGQQLGQWYDEAGELYERAVQIWESPASNQSQLNKDWRAAELHHRNEARLIDERAAAVRSTISRQFGVEFPEFGKQSTPADGNPTAAAG